MFFKNVKIYIRIFVIFVIFAKIMEINLQQTIHHAKKIVYVLRINVYVLYMY